MGTSGCYAVIFKTSSQAQLPWVFALLVYRFFCLWSLHAGCCCFLLGVSIFFWRATSQKDVQVRVVLCNATSPNGLSRKTMIRRAFFLVLYHRLNPPSSRACIASPYNHYYRRGCQNRAVCHHTYPAQRGVYSGTSEPGSTGTIHSDISRSCVL